jgi:hypothetical protein
LFGAEHASTLMYRWLLSKSHASLVCTCVDVTVNEKLFVALDVTLLDAQGVIVDVAEALMLPVSVVVTVVRCPLMPCLTALWPKPSWSHSMSSLTTRSR